MRSVAVSIFIIAQVLPGLLFKSCVAELPPKSAQSSPNWLSLKMDSVWHGLSLKLAKDVTQKRRDLHQKFKVEKKKLVLQADLIEPNEDETRTEGVYGLVPEVIVDPAYNAYVFPRPIASPDRFSWFQTYSIATDLLKALDKFQVHLKNSSELSLPERKQQFERLARVWNLINSQFVSMAQQIRYLEAWLPQLEKYWAEENAAGRKPIHEMIVLYFNQKSSNVQDLTDADRDLLKPHRELRRSFLPENLKEVPAGIVILPIATDIQDKKFLAEMEGAMDTHWNQSSWAKENKVSFLIKWIPFPINKAFAQKKETLIQHLAHLSKSRKYGSHAGLTTGGLNTHVRGQVLVLGPSKITPRTLAHEMGHLLGFPDCYFRTLTSQGIFGLGVLEWDNPLYSDDIMCDNLVGEPRAEVW